MLKLFQIKWKITNRASFLSENAFEHLEILETSSRNTEALDSILQKHFQRRFMLSSN